MRIKIMPGAVQNKKSKPSFRPSTCPSQTTCFARNCFSKCRTASSTPSPCHLMSSNHRSLYSLLAPGRRPPAVHSPKPTSSAQVTAPQLDLTTHTRRRSGAMCPPLRVRGRVLRAETRAACGGAEWRCAETGNPACRRRRGGIDLLRN